MLNDLYFLTKEINPQINQFLLLLLKIIPKNGKVQRKRFTKSKT